MMGEGGGEKVSLLQLSPFFASIFPLFPQKRLILRLGSELSNYMSSKCSARKKVPSIRLGQVDFPSWQVTCKFTYNVPGKKNLRAACPRDNR